MKRHLFLTGPMGCGKSTAIDRAVGAKLPNFGGFLTKRVLGPDGHAQSFCLESPDGAKREIFLDFSAGKPEVHLEVFQNLAVSLLTGDILTLDEIGGIELLCPEFTAALETVLASDVPILGVMKGEAPADALIRALGLTEEYEIAVQNLRKALREDENTLLYECGQFDEQALRLAQAWVKEYADASLF